MNTTSKLSNLDEIKRLQFILKLTFGLVPIVAGLDKFTNLLTDWSKYLSPQLVSILPFSATTFMMIAGIIEITAGVFVLFKTEIGAYIVSIWLMCISLILLASMNYMDVAVRDGVMAIGAFILARLTRMKETLN